MDLTEIIFETVRLFRSFHSTSLRMGAGRNPLSLWIAPLAFMGRQMAIDSIVLYSLSKKGRTSLRKEILSCPQKSWQDLPDELNLSNSKSLLLPIPVPRKVKHKGTRPLCYLGIFKDTGLTKDQKYVVNKVADFFADNVYDNMSLRRQLDAKRAMDTILSYIPTVAKPGSIACNVGARLKAAMDATATYICILDGSTLHIEYFQKKHWSKPTMVPESLSVDVPKPLQDLLHSHSFFQWLDLSDAKVMTPIVNKLIGINGGPWTYLYIVLRSDDSPIACIVLQFWKDEVIFLEAATDLLHLAQSVLAIPARFLYQRRTNKMFVEPIYRARDTKCDDKLVFIIMPFTEKWSDRIWTRIVRPLIESEGLEPKRADDIYGRDIMEDIWTNILRSRFVVADVTGRNPNVFYELGLAHAIGKPVVLLTQSVSDIPFDLNRYRHIVYEDNLDGYDVLNNKLKASIREL